MAYLSQYFGMLFYLKLFPSYLLFHLLNFPEFLNLVVEVASIFEVFTVKLLSQMLPRKWEKIIFLLIFIFSSASGMCIAINFSFQFGIGKFVLCTFKSFILDPIPSTLVLDQDHFKNQE